MNKLEELAWRARDMARADRIIEPTLRDAVLQLADSVLKTNAGLQFRADYSTLEDHPATLAVLDHLRSWFHRERDSNPGVDKMRERTFWDRAASAIGDARHNARKALDERAGIQHCTHVGDDANKCDACRFKRG